MALAGRGGGISGGSLTLDDCTFTSNSAQYEGGGITCYRSTLSNCTFIANTTALFSGGISTGDSILIDCTFDENSAEYGGAIYNGAKLVRCAFRRNSASEGGAIFNDHSDLTIEYCIFIWNSADYGGAIENCNDINAILTNCVFSGNSANLQGGALYKYNSRPTLTNCTFAGNSTLNGNAIACDSYQQKYPSNVELINCILWDDGKEIWNNDGSTISISYSDIQGGWPGKYNINLNPRFVDADGADNVFGTEDDNLRLRTGSPCIDAGNTLVIPPSMFKDLDGYLRITNDIVDMGAYEFGSQLVLYINAVNGDDNNDGFTPESAFATIQKGIETAQDDDIVLVYPGVYQEEVNFLGKSITVKKCCRAGCAGKSG